MEATRSISAPKGRNRTAQGQRWEPMRPARTAYGDRRRPLAFVLALLAGALTLPASRGATTSFSGPAEVGVTHGPLLGNVTSNSVRVWGRTARPGTFRVRFSEDEGLAGASTSRAVRTVLERDNTGWIDLGGLRPDRKYYYALEVDGRVVDTRIDGRFNSFRTLPDAESVRHPELNPRGLFNFAFEFGCGNWQYINSREPDHEKAYGTPLDVAYRTMLGQLKDRIHFHIVNGDWIYEEATPPPGHDGTGLPGDFRGLTGREVTEDQWARDQGIGGRLPQHLQIAHGIAGVWQNYKTYLERGVNMTNFHREVPLFVMFDDHEIYNDVLGAGEVGLRMDARAPEYQGNPFNVDNVRFWQQPERRVSGYHGFRAYRQTHAGEVERSVFRDPGLQAWQDYLGWANPDAGVQQPIHFGRARLQEGSDVLHDPAADFRSLDLKKAATLHVLFGQGNSGVYEIAKVIDRHRVQIRPAATLTEEARYSIGTNHHTRFRIGNSEFFILDTRSHRTRHNPGDSHDPSVTMLGRNQVEWLRQGMKESDADFFFLVSSVSFMVPHDNGAWRDGGDKDESWTVYAAERDGLLDFFETMERPVFLLTGDIHNSFAVKISPLVWEFMSSPHMSNNHKISDMGNVPLSGPYVSQGRPVEIRWGTGRLDDTPQPRQSMYCVVTVNNAFNSPDAAGNPRWVAHPAPQVTFRFHHGVTGDFLYAESIALPAR
jgi:alkaline phosphatase D